MTELKTWNDLNIEDNLCRRLDENVYLPVKSELKDCGTEYSLGQRKEQFKQEIETELKQVRDAAIEKVKSIRSDVKKAFPAINEVGRKIQGSALMEFFNIKEEELTCQTTKK